jgi:hypothetical protein
VRASGITTWERKFMASLIARNRSGRFVPSRGQLVQLRRVVGEFKERTMRDEPVIE